MKNILHPAGNEKKIRKAFVAFFAAGADFIYKHGERIGKRRRLNRNCRYFAEGWLEKVEHISAGTGSFVVNDGKYANATQLYRQTF